MVKRALRLLVADDVAGPSRSDSARLRRWAQATMAEFPPSGGVDIVLVDDAAIRELNVRYRGIDQPTDVLSFDLGDAAPAATGAPAGEIYISVDRARAQASELDVPLLEELGRLMIHGLLHLAGRDHPTPAELESMEADTERLLAGD